MIPTGGLQSRKNACSASGWLEQRGQGKDTSTVSHSALVNKESRKETALRLHNTINLRQYAPNLSFRLRNNSRVRRIGRYVFFALRNSWLDAFIPLGNNSA